MTTVLGGTMVTSIMDRLRHVTTRNTVRRFSHLELHLFTANSRYTVLVFLTDGAWACRVVTDNTAFEQSDETVELFVPGPRPTPPLNTIIAAHADYQMKLVDEYGQHSIEMSNALVEWACRVFEHGIWMERLDGYSWITTPVTSAEVQVQVFDL